MKWTQTITHQFEFTERELDLLRKLSGMNWVMFEDDGLVAQYQQEWLALLAEDIVATANESIYVTDFGIDIFMCYPAPKTYILTKTTDETEQ